MFKRQFASGIYLSEDIIERRSYDEYTGEKSTLYY